MNCNRRNKIAEYEVGEHQMNYLEKLNYEVEGLRVLLVNLSSIVESPDVDAVYNKLRDEYRQKFAERQIVLNEIVMDVVPDKEAILDTVFAPDFYKGVLVAYEQ